MKNTLYLILALIIFVAPVFAQGYSESAYIFGIHDPGGEYNMAEKGKKGWILFTVEVGRNPQDYSGGDFRGWADQGYGVIVRINHGYGSNGSLPYDYHYDNFAQRVGNYVLNSYGCRIWIIGNETNHPNEWPRYEGAEQQITSSRYATCFKKCRVKIKVGGHASDQVVTQGTAPWNAQIGQGWIDYHVTMLNSIGSSNVDGIALHTYTHGSNPSLIYSEEMMGAPYQNCHYHFRTYKDFLNSHPSWAKSLPVYITETDQNDPWADTNSGWIKNAYGEINSWNHSGGQKIRALILYRWPNLDQWYIQGKGQVINDFREAMDNDYRWNN